MTRGADGVVPLVHRDMLPWRGGDERFEELFANTEALLGHPNAKITVAGRHRIVVSAPASKIPHSVTIRNGCAGNRDGTGGQSIWLSIGKSIELRIEKMDEKAERENLSLLSVGDVARRFGGFVDLWKVRTAAIRHRDDVVPSGPSFEASNAAFDEALRIVVEHVATTCAVSGIPTTPFVQIVANLDGPPDVVVEMDSDRIGAGHMSRCRSTRCPTMSEGLQRLLDPSLRGCMIEHGPLSMHLCFTPVVARMAIVQPADAMQVLHHHANPAFRGIPTEFS